MEAKNKFKSVAGHVGWVMWHAVLAVIVMVVPPYAMTVWIDAEAFSVMRIIPLVGWMIYLLVGFETVGKKSAENGSGSAAPMIMGAAAWPAVLTWQKLSGAR